jgi:hypothetical protein
MNATLLLLTLAAPPGEGNPGKDPPRRPSAIAPSLPALTREEEDGLDEAVERFIKSDIGLLRGQDAREAVHDFEALGPEAIPALIRGLNRAAAIQHSCPAVVIAKKLRRMFLASDDEELLEFARDNIGAGVGRTRHASVLQDLRFACMLRKNALARMPRGPRAARAMTTAELAEAAGSAQGPRLRQVLVELEQRRGRDVLDGLVTATSNSDRATGQFARDLLDRHLGGQKPGFVQEKLKDEQPEVRRAAARVVAARMPRLAGDLIDLLTDERADVRGEAHQALVRLSGGQDFGPPADASRDQFEEAQKKWRDWWRRQRG